MRFWLLLLFALASIVPAQAAPLSERQKRLAEEFAINNSLFILHHEVAHLLFDRLSLPVLGREEDAADNMATYVLLDQRTPTADKVLADAARGWQLYGKLYGGELSLEDFYDEHSLDGQRAFQIVCLMVGSERKGFRDIANDYGIDLDRQESCERDYDLTKRSLESLLERHRNQGGKSTDVRITYHPAPGALSYARDVFKRSGIFEQVADELRKNYALGTKVSFNARRCDEVNAFYDADTVEIIFCYEMIDDLITMISNEMPPESQAGSLPGRAGSQSAG